jgi:hypothetical protein
MNPMERDLTDEELDAIWDDESGIPPPMSAEEMDVRLSENTTLLREKRQMIERQNRTIAELIARYTALLEELEAEKVTLPPVERSLETVRLRDTLLQLAESSMTVARGL